jgi:predicted Zn-dependent protease
MTAAVVAELVDLPHADVLVSLWLNEAGEIQASLQLLEELSKSGPDRPDLHFGFAEVARTTGRTFDAWTHLNAAESAPRAATWSSEYVEEFSRSVSLSKALVSELRNDWQNAKAQYEKLKAAGVTEPAVELGLGRASFKLGAFEKAEAHFRELARLAPKAYIAESLMAGLYAEQKKSAEAEAWLKKGVLENQEHSDQIRLEYAMWLLREQRAPEAVKLAQKALESNTEFADEFALVRAIAFYMYEKYGDAELVLARLAQKEIGNVLLSNLLALTLVESEDEGKRARALQIAIANAGATRASLDILSSLAYIQYRLGDRKAAEQTTAAILSRGGQLNRDSTYFLAQFLFTLGKTAEAESLLQASRESSGDFFNARRLERETKSKQAN